MAETNNNQTVSNTQAPSVQAGGSSGIIGGLLNNTLGLGLSFAYSKALQKRQHKYNQELSEYQFDRNLAQWNRQNEYNSPLSQRQRLEEAGLNPALMYGNGAVSTGNSNSMPQYQAFGQDLANNMMAAAQIQQMAANARLTNAKAKEQEEKNPFVADEAQAIIDNYLSTTQVNEHRVKEIIKGMEKTDVEIQQVRKVMDEIDARIAYTKTQEKGQQIINDLNEMEKVTKTLQQAAIRVSMDKDRANINYLESQTGYTKAMTANINVKTWLDEWEKIYIEEYGYKPDTNMWSLVSQVVSGTIGKNTNKINGIYDNVFGPVDRKIDNWIEDKFEKVKGFFKGNKSSKKSNPSISRYNGR